MKLFLLSDTHVGVTEGDCRAQAFKKAMADIASIACKGDYLDIAGDYSADGRPAEVKTFFDILYEHAPLPRAHILVAMGNHDARGADNTLWNRDDSRVSEYWAQARRLYEENNRRFAMPTGAEIPAFGGNELGLPENAAPGAGYVVEIGPEKLLFCARNFVLGAWLPQYDTACTLPPLAELCRRRPGAAAKAADKINAVFTRKYQQQGLNDDRPSLPPARLFGWQTQQEIAQIKDLLR